MAETNSQEDEIWPPGFKIGASVRIKPTVKEHGSGRIIQGLTATIAAPHPVIDSWVKIKLDPTPVVQYLDWSIAIERLELL